MSASEPLPLSLHQVDSFLINQRAQELSSNRGLKRPDLKGALAEVVERYVDEAGDNLDEDRNLVIYQPSTENDPYIVAVPVKEVLKGEPTYKRKDTLQEDFEAVLFESEIGCRPSEIDKDEKGRYINPHTRKMWYGFNLYHQKMVRAHRVPLQEKYHRPLGSYVIGKVFENGSVTFATHPKRIQTRALAYETAQRLQEEKGEAWGVYRCLDVIGYNDVLLERDREDV